MNADVDFHLAAVGGEFEDTVFRDVVIRFNGDAVSDARSDELDAHADGPDRCSELSLDVSGTSRTRVSVNVDDLTVFVDASPDGAGVGTASASSVLHSFWLFNIDVVLNNFDTN